MVRWLEYKAECHICGEMTTMRSDSLAIGPVKLPYPWREVSIIGWVSTFDICSDKCEKTLRARYERPEKGSVPAPDNDEEITEDTIESSQPPDEMNS